MFRRIMLATAVALLLGAGSASAATTRYASPSPAAGADCSLANPCDIATAFSGAVSGDTISIGAGTYGSAISPVAPLSDAGHTLTIAGAPGMGSEIFASGAPAALQLTGAGTSVSDLHLEQVGGGEGLQMGATSGALVTATRIWSHSNSNGLDGCDINHTGGTLTDSLCVSDRIPVTALSVHNNAQATIRNVTAYGRTDGLGVTPGNAPGVALTVINSILHGTGGNDVSLNNGGGFGLSAFLGNSDFITTSLQGSPTVSQNGNIHTAPVFTDTTSFYEASTSPTIDVGDNSSFNGPLDLNQNLRTVGTGTDMGAREFLPSAPTPLPTAATSVTQTTVTLNGTVNPNSGRSTVGFRLGHLSPTIGVPAGTLAAGTAPLPVSATFSSLMPNTNYVYRVEASSDGGAANSSTVSFTTLPDPPGVSTTPVSAPGLTGATLNGTVNPNGAASSYHFDFGTNASFAAGSFSSTPSASAGSGTSAVSVSAPVGSLHSATTYYYRLVATNTGGTSTSAPVGSFQTAAPPSPLKPTNTEPPTISGTAKAGKSLSCSTGQWENNPTTFAYRWSRNGTPLIGATEATYTVQSLDEGSALTCTVTASNGNGAGPPATSPAVKIALPFVPRCPRASGHLSNGTLGLISLGMTRAQARRSFRHSSSRGRTYQDFFCLTPRGVRDGYATPKLLGHLSARDRRGLTGRIVWISTANPFYSLNGVRPGATLPDAERRLPHGNAFAIGANQWYLTRYKRVTAVLKVRQGAVQEIGVADQRLTKTRSAQVAFMKSFY